MELRRALRTTGAVRAFENRHVEPAVLYDILDDARFAPSGGNRQAWRVIVVEDPLVRREVASIYLEGWFDYLGYVYSGQVGFSPLASPEERRVATEKRAEAVAASRPDGFAETLSTVPAMLVVVADLGALAATDRDLERYQLVGGASVYPFVWSVLLAAHDRGLGGVLTTVATSHEPELREVLRLPAHFAVASLVVLGYPLERATRLRRRGVEEFTTLNRFDGPSFTR